MRSLLLVLMALPIALSAQTVPNGDISRCASLENAVNRLECFDELAMANKLAPTSEATSLDDKGGWYTQTDIDPLNDKNVYLAALTASEGRARFGKDITLAVVCKNNKTEMYIMWNDFLGSNRIQTTYRIGKDKSTTSAWPISTDKKAAFFPGSPIPLLKKLMEVDSFVANVTPYNENPVTALFNTAGSQAALADIRKGCNW